MSAGKDIQPVALAEGRVRAVVEGVAPAVDGGRFPTKRVGGDVSDFAAIKLLKFATS